MATFTAQMMRRPGGAATLDAELAMEKLLHWTLRRMRVVYAVRKAAAVALVAVPLSLLILVALRLWPVIEPAWLALIIAAAPLPVFAAAYLLHRPAILSAAVTVDRAGQLREAASTAVAFRGKNLPPELADALKQQADLATAALKPASVRKAMPMRGLAWLAAAAVALLVGAVAGNHVPSLGSDVIAQDQKTDEEKAEEAQKVREAARKTDADLSQLQKAAELRKMEALRRTAMDARKKMEQLQQQPTSVRDAMAEFSKLADQARMERAELLGTQAELKFGMQEAEDPLSALARELDRIDPTGLDADLDKFKQALEAEAQAAKAEGREPEVDRRKLEEMLKRTRDAQKALEELQKRMEENPALRQALKEMTDKQRELLKKINEQLERLESTCKGCESPGGGQLKPEDLEQAAEGMGGLSEEQLQQILDALQEAESLEELAQMLEGAKGRMAGKGKGGQGEGEGEGMGAGEAEQLEAQLRAMIQRLQRGAGGGPGPNRGQGEGGEANKGPDDGRPDDTTKVNGKLDPKGNMGRSTRFKGVPRESESKSEFKQAVNSAIKDAEESLEQDEVPPDARPFVKRYFEALKER
jgi:hypothetical protein